MTGGRDGSRARPRSCWPRWRRRRTSHSPSCRRCERARPAVGTGTVWRFFDRHGIRKKTAHAAEQERPSPRAGWPGSKANPISIPADWCSSMRPAPRPRWPVCGAARTWPRCRAAVPHGRKTPRRDLPRRSPGRADDGVAFLAYVEQVLVPTLVPGDQVRTLPALASNRQSRRRARHVCSCRLIRPIQSHRIRQTQGPAQKGRRSNRR